MDPSVISLAARALRARLSAELGLVEGNIFIGHPAAAVEKAEGQADKQFLNLFFFQVEHAGYPADGSNLDPTYVRLHCLITAFGNNEAGTGNGKATAGENDLKLIGGVVAALHQAPILTVENEDETAIAELQVVPMPFSIENINNLWSTQLNASYRLSVAYELALAPVPFEPKIDRSPRVGAPGVEVSPFPSAEVDGRSAGEHACEIRFVAGDSADHELALSFAESSLPASVPVVFAGKPGETVTLIWEIWTRAAGWSVSDEREDVTLAAAQLADAEPVSVSLPAETSLPRQYMLVATGSWRGGDGRLREIRSNRLLISVFEEAES